MDKLQELYVWALDNDDGFIHFTAFACTALFSVIYMMIVVFLAIWGIPFLSGIMIIVPLSFAVRHAAQKHKEMKDKYKGPKA